MPELRRTRQPQPTTKHPAPQPNCELTHQELRYISPIFGEYYGDSDSDYAHDIIDNLLTGFANQRLRPVLDGIAAADGLILVTPTFTASYSGLFKSFIDIVDPETVRDKPVLLAATGGTERHSLVLEHALRPLLAHLHAQTVPTAVYAASSDWGNDTGLEQRVTRAASELATAVRRRPERGVSDPFTNPVPFDQLLHSTATHRRKLDA